MNTSSRATRGLLFNLDQIHYRERMVSMGGSMMNLSSSSRGVRHLVISAVVLAAVCLGCQQEIEDDMGPLIVPQTDGAVAPDAELDSLSITVRLLDPSTARGVEGVSVSTESESQVTGSDGRAVLQIAPGRYQVRIEREGTRPYLLFGEAGDSDFEQITFFSGESITGFVFRALGLSDQPDKGMVVVGLDLPNLAPAVGAEATLSAAHDTPFILTSRPVEGNSITEGAGGFVTFPNVEPGEVEVQALYPTGSCLPFPAETGSSTITVEAGSVSILAFTCRAE